MYRRIAEFSWFSGLSQKQENRSLNECEILI